jgi:ketosteroid isomerase-like protein
MASNAERAATLVRAVEASIEGDSSVIAELYTDDVTGWAPALRVSSAAELAVELEDREEAFSEIDLDVVPLDVSGDRACVEWVARMTHSGPFVIDDDIVIDPTGQRITLVGVTVAEFEGERIRSFRQYWDEAALLEQLMLLPDEDEDGA